MKYFLLIIFVLFNIKGIDSSHLFDLNPNNPDNSIDLNRTFTITEEFILSDNAIANYYYNASANWSAIYVAILSTNAQEFDRVQSDFGLASSQERVPLHLQLGDFDSQSLTANEIDEFNTSLSLSILSGLKFTSTKIENTTDFIMGVFNSIRFQFIPPEFFKPRTICIIAEETQTLDQTVGCISIEYIGTNDNPVQISYTQIANVFMEGSEPIQVLNSDDLMVQHDDHPSYLIREMIVEIMHPDIIYERLSLNVTNQSIYHYDEIDGKLTLTINGSEEDYTQYLKSVLYVNNNPEPMTENRTLFFTIADFEAAPGKLKVIVSVVNVNDETEFIFSEARLMKYTEGSGLELIDTGLMITDNDTNPLIESVTIELFDEDSEYEYLSINDDSTWFDIEINDTKIYVTGTGNLTQYASVLQSLSYLHDDSNPGNPTQGQRIIQFNVYDGIDTTSIVFEFEVIPINDAPILLLANEINFDLILTGNTTKTVSYTEDDPALLFATDVYLQDVDSDISSVSIALFDLRDSVNEVFLFDETLLQTYNVTLQQIDDNISLDGEASAGEYEEILQSLSYQNTIQDDTIGLGIRTVSFTAFDVHGDESDNVTININVDKRNDEPGITINEYLVYEEGATSIEIATPHILSLMDEEQNGISNISIRLVAINGELDAGDSLAFRSAHTSLLNSVQVFPTYISTSDPGTVDEYENFLRSIRYINQEVEPTYYVNSSSKELLMRAIIIEITDNGQSPSTGIYTIMINITLKNDEKPVIKINLVDSTCSAVRPDVPMVLKMAKRDTNTFNRLHKRLYSKRRSNIIGSAPAVTASYYQLSANGNNCMSNITITFSSDTSAPPVEFKRDLLEVISLLPTSLNSHIQYGRWNGRKSVIISLIGCYKDTVDASGLKVVFEPTKGDSECNSTSECTDGICFSNSTGCPVAGFSSITTNVNMSSPLSSYPATSTDIPSQSPSADVSYGTTDYPLTTYIALLLTAIVVSIILLMCGVKMATTDSAQTTKVKSIVDSEATVMNLCKFDKVKCSTVNKVQTLKPQPDNNSGVIPSKESLPAATPIITDEILEELKKTVDDENNTTKDNPETNSTIHSNNCQECNDSVVQLPPVVVIPLPVGKTTDSLLKRPLPLNMNDQKHSNKQIRTLAQLDSKDR